MRTRLTAVDTILSIVSLGVLIFFLVGQCMGLDSIPPGFFVDESSIGLNAYTIATRGVDEHGARLPLYFAAFGDYKNPIYIYSIVPLLGIFGPHVWSVRLGSLLWVLAALVVLLLLMKVSKSNKLVVVSTLALALSSPWTTHLSRVAFEVACTPFFILLAAYFLYKILQVKTHDTKATHLLCYFGASLGLLFYSYTSARLLAPLLLTAGVLLISKKLGWRSTGWAISTWAICLLPLFFSQTVADGALSARYEIVGLSRYVEGPWELLTQATQNYFKHFAPQFLFHGDGNYRHTAVPYGVFYYSAIPLILYGIYHGVWKKREFFAYWSLFGLLISPIPSSLTIQSPHVLRSIGLLAFSFIFMWYGIQAWQSTKNRWLHYIGLVCIFASLLEAIIFANFYRTKFAAPAGPWFERETVEGIQKTYGNPGPYAFPTNLYPGTEASIYFFAAEHKIDTSQIRFYTPPIRRTQ